MTVNQAICLEPEEPAAGPWRTERIADAIAVFSDRTHDMAYVVEQSDATTLISAGRSGPVNYLAMIEELLPSLRQQDSSSTSWLLSRR
jgi:hypothetical protein